LQAASKLSSQDCAGIVSGAALVLRILPRSTPAAAAFRDTAFGYAEGSAWANVFYGRIQDFALGENGNNREVPVIMGHVIAHEIGHLLLGSASHSPDGIMCAKWDPSTVRRALTGRLLFSSAQSDRIRDEVSKRSMQPASSEIPSAMDSRPEIPLNLR
jgi:hypothetical protein